MCGLAGGLWKNASGQVVKRTLHATAARLVTLIDDAELRLRMRMGTQAKKEMQVKYSITANVDRYYAPYAELLADV
jgi:hypothetical protein